MEILLSDRGTGLKAVFPLEKNSRFILGNHELSVQSSGYENVGAERVYEVGTLLWELGSFITCLYGISEMTAGLRCPVLLSRRMQKLLW